MALVEDHDEGPPSKRTRKYCCHCSEYVGYSICYRHRERFFDLYPISRLLIVVQVKSGRLQIRIPKLARTKLIPMKFSLIFKDSTVVMKVPVYVYCCTRALRALYNLWLYWECIAISGW